MRTLLLIATILFAIVICLSGCNYQAYSSILGKQQLRKAYSPRYEWTYLKDTGNPYIIDSLKELLP